MSRFERKWSREQKDAVTFAAIDRKVKRSRIAELARNGELTGRDGTQLEPFNMPDGTIASEIKEERRRRAGQIQREIVAKPPRDAIEQLRRNLVACADVLVEQYAKTLQQGKPNTADPERLRQIVRAVREAAALPGPNDARPPKPSAKVNGKREGGDTTGSNTLAGSILSDALKAKGEPLRNEGTETKAQGEAGSAAPQRTQGEDEGHSEGEPGSLALALATPGAGLSAGPAA